MHPKKKRTYWVIADKNLNLYTSNYFITMFDSKEEAEEVINTTVDSASLKVLRVTLTASTAGWK